MGGRDDRAILIADDDAGVRLLCRVNLEHEGYRVLEAESASTVEQAVSSDRVSLVLLDIHLGTDDGLAVARGLRDTRPDIAIALFSGSVRELPPSAQALADGVLTKPFSLEDLSATVERLASS